MTNRWWMLALIVLCSSPARAQIDEDQTGVWYSYNWNHDRKSDRFGFQGDIQYRNWDLDGDLEQFLVRGGMTWRPRDSSIKFTLGLAHATSGDFGSSRDTFREIRFYEEALIPHRLGMRSYVTHRFRLEQRQVEGQNSRNRLRYALTLNYPLNQDTLGEGALYLSLTNELFLNLERHIGDGRRVDRYDRNRASVSLGYSWSDGMRLQVGYMHQHTRAVHKGQLLVTVVHNF
jgi:hypothetical protein